MGAVAKKYVKALLHTLENEELNALLQDIKSLVPAYKNKKFQAILQANDVTKEQKSEFLLSMMEHKDSKIENFIKTLVANDRVDILPTLEKELSFQVAKKTNSYKGVVISSEALDEEKIKEIETLLSGKFDATISLENRVGAYNGLKVEIESLGVEIGLSTDRLKSQIEEIILSAI